MSLQIDKGEFVFLSGNSGAGKTTLLELVLRDTRPDKGDIWVNGIELGSLRERQVYQYRRYIG
ncbi:ATP-binding cassette domain-containing protein, partial [Eggerthella lenta]|uniref:ATP-binding cassette domain-containing protein n=1 Tax=Eggerthella lenta TaxID=84112 RepID=UPI001D10458A|nr:ATP-binding cassette domain-containing protein [Eggerthella lenta]